MRVQVDAHLCSGHARCNAVSPAVFRLDDEGFSAADRAEVGEPDLVDASRGALACPEGAISLVTDDGDMLSEEDLRQIAGH